jgi:uncharacterized protein (DUF433 family)
MAKEKHPAAVALSRLGASKGGRARAAGMTPKQRSQSARNAVQARWGTATKRKERDMEKLDWSKCPVVESRSDKHHGDLIFKDSRLPVAVVFQCLADNASIDDIMDWYGADPEQIKAVLKFIATSLEQAPVHANSVRP